ncbi:hypothetical protein BGW39_009737 [Mortierella sp. 14UC]|nr:hypothetical protein BGW39_009737 [Mortierella sp. 14UC]
MTDIGLEGVDSSGLKFPDIKFQRLGLPKTSRYGFEKRVRATDETVTLASKVGGIPSSKCLDAAFASVKFDMFLPSNKAF